MTINHHYFPRYVISQLRILINLFSFKKNGTNLLIPSFFYFTNYKCTEQGLIVASNVGRVELSLAYFTKQGTLKVTILRCINLPEMDNQGSANPFVQV